jgi:predicted transcriptional regulator
MAQSVLEMAKELVMAQIQRKHLLPGDMQQTLHKTFATLMTLQMREEAGERAPVRDKSAVLQPVGWKHSISRHTVACLECGATFKQLTVRHLREHGLDGRSYRVKYGIPRMQPLSAISTTAQRKQIVQRTRPWEHSPKYVQSQHKQTKRTAAAKGSQTRNA